MNDVPTTRIPHNRGFSLLEVIGVLAVTGILAAVITPSVIGQINRAAADAERETLATLAKALRRYVTEHHEVPAERRWTRAVAQVSALPPTQVLRTRRGHRRGYYVDPRFFTTTSHPFPGYRQVRGLDRAPVSPRIMLVSMVDRDAPPAPRSAQAFEAIWSQRRNAPLVEGPRVFIERVHLSDVFVRVLLANEKGARPGYRLESGPPTALPPAPAGGQSTLTRYVIVGTRLALLADPAPGGAVDRATLATGPLVARYRFDGTRWGWEIRP